MAIQSPAKAQTTEQLQVVQSWRAWRTASRSMLGKDCNVGRQAGPVVPRACASMSRLGPGIIGGHWGLSCSALQLIRICRYTTLFLTAKKRCSRSVNSYVVQGSTKFGELSSCATWRSDVWPRWSCLLERSPSVSFCMALSGSGPCSKMGGIC